MTMITNRDQMFKEYLVKNMSEEEFEEVLVKAQLETHLINSSPMFVGRISNVFQHLNARPSELKEKFLRTVVDSRPDFANIVQCFYGLETVV